MRAGVARMGVAIMLAASASRLEAQQQLRGLVRDSSTGQPVSGAVISVLDTGGRVGARTIATEQGRFSVLLGEGAARVRVIRIGYLPREVAISAGGGDGTLSITMVKAPALLESVLVQDKSLCPGSTERSGALALWEQARAGLLATVVAREAKPARVRNLVFDRTLDPGDDRVVHMRTDVHAGMASRPFVASVAPEAFTRIGYMQETGSVRTYHAPDADVLLDETFATTHCLHVARDSSGHPGQIGLAFTPAPGRDSLVEVAGTLWLDAAVPALRTLEFRFVNIEPAAVDARSGGVLTFRTMPNGIAMIERWTMRLVAMTEVRSLNKLPGQIGPNDWRGRRTRRDLRVYEIREHGGFVLGANWPGGVDWVATLGGVAGRITRRGSRLPIANAAVWIEGTTDSLASDADGRFAIGPVIPGRYTLKVADTTFGAFIGPRGESRSLTVGQGVVSQLDAELPNVDDVAKRMCSDAELPERTSILLGQVVNWDLSPARDFELKATWQAGYGRVVGVEGGAITATIMGRERKVDPDDQGHFHLCGVVRERPIRLHVTHGTAVLLDTAVFLYGDTLVRTSTIRLPPRR